jgi:hypothetical protein
MEEAMFIRSTTAGLALLAAAIAGGPPAQALTMQECSAKYKAAQNAGSLKGMKWNDFRKAECGPEATAAPASAPGTATTTVAPRAEPKQVNRQTSAPAAPIGNAIFPSAVSPKYSKESEGKARMHTCLDQYNANKATNGNGGMKWIEKGGGYYSECNKRLKG